MTAIFIGGDLRQKYACEYLNYNNIYSEFYDNFKLDNSMIKTIENFSIIALPLPVLMDDRHLNMSGENQIELLNILKLCKNCMVFGGKIPKWAVEYLKNNNVPYYDYYELESFQIQNALLSAEGAIYYVKDKLDRSIAGLKIAILGFGRIAKILAYLLHSQGAKISIYARKESDIAWCKLIGLNPVKIDFSGDKSNIKLYENDYDIIYNTIPAKIMDENFSMNLTQDTIIVDLASYPFGIDDLLVKKYKLKYYRELGIPGRYAPRNAGEIIGQTILNTIGRN